MHHGVTPANEIPDDFVRAQVERIAAGAILPEKARHLIVAHRKDQPRVQLRELYPELFAASPVDLHPDMCDYLAEYGRGLEPTRTDAGLALRYARGVARWDAYGAAMWDGCGACEHCWALRQSADGAMLKNPIAEDPELRQVRLQMRPAGYNDLRQAFVDAAQPRRPLANLWADALDACSHGMAMRGEQTFAQAREYGAELRERYSAVGRRGTNAGSADSERGGESVGGRALPLRPGTSHRAGRGRKSADKWTPAGRVFAQVVQLVDACGGDLGLAERRMADRLTGE